MDSHFHIDLDEPFFLQWHLTGNCNLGCVHCYREEPKGEMALEDLKRVLADYADFLKAMGRSGRIQFNGGEPLLSPHLFDLIKAAKNLDLHSRVISNGTLVTYDSAKWLKRSGCGLVDVSLDGLEATHDALRRNGSFEQAVEGIAILREYDIKVTVSMTVSRLNAGQVLAVARLAEVAADRFSFSRLVPIGNGQALRDECLSQEETRRLFARLFRFRRQARIEMPLRDPLWKPFLNQRLSDDSCVAGCAAGYNGLAVDSNGDVYPCRRLPIVLGNILEQPLAEIWRSPILEVLRDRDSLEGKCGSCRLRWVCGGCRAVALACTGNPMAEDPQCFRQPSWLESTGKGIAAKFRNIRNLVLH